MLTKKLRLQLMYATLSKTGQKPTGVVSTLQIAIVIANSIEIIHKLPSPSV